MKYQTPAAFRAALLERLRADAARTGVSPEQLRKRVVFERFLARLVAVAPGQWVVKGGIGLALRLGGRIRTTRDLDLLGPHDADAMAEDLIAAQQLVLDDDFSLTITRSPEPTRIPGSLRYHLTTELGGGAFDQAVMDVEVRGVDEEPTETVQSHLLAFADVPPVTIPVIPLEVQIAEKVHAYTRTYGPDRSEARTRPKDLADLYGILTQLNVDAAHLRDALDRVFRRRGTHHLPPSFPPPPPDWARPFQRMMADMQIVVTLEEASTRVAAALNPSLNGTARGQWDPVRLTWQAQ